MIKKTHIALGVVSVLPVVSHVNLIYIPIGLIGSIFPDYDILLGLKHRWITHNFVALAVTTFFTLFISQDLAITWGLCYFSHLFADSLTKMGIPALYPISKKYYGLKIFRTGGTGDYSLLLLCLYIIFQYITRTLGIIL